MLVGMFFTYSRDTPWSMAYYLTTYLGIPPPSLTLRTAIVTRCPASLLAFRNGKSFRLYMCP